ncbi:MAG: triose-phosphate isomerase [Dehalococcoidia bacterium]
MKRTPIIAGNWKMHTTAESALALATAVRDLVDRTGGVEKVVCPPFPFLMTVAGALKGSSVRVGAQNLHWEPQGAFTGEVSPPMLQGLVDFVIIGHSERRAYFCDTDETVNKKVKAALAANLRPILCVGEMEQQREDGQTAEVLVRQTRGALAGVDLPAGFAIAYEPVWAIGTGKAATGDMANEAIALIRSEVTALFDVARGDSLRILYGGSVTPDNIAEFIAQPDIDGALVGGACLKADSFARIVDESARISATK